MKSFIALLLVCLMVVKSVFGAFPSRQQRSSSSFATVMFGGDAVDADAVSSPSFPHGRELDEGQGTDAPSDKGTPEEEEGGLHAIGTRVSIIFPNGWRYGVITGYTRDQSSYIIEYEDGSTETFPVDSEFIESMINQADNYVPYPVGTEVYREMDEVFGTITGFDNGNWIYTIQWNDGTVQRIYELEMINTFVEAAEWAPGRTVSKEKGGEGGSDNMGGGMKAFIIIAILVVLFVVVFRSRKRETGSYDKRFGRAERIAQQYKDRNINLHDLELSHLT
jgi:hypothetical protein